MRRSLCLVVGAIAGCGPSQLPSGSSERTEQLIIGGTLSLDDTQVFALGTGSGMFCTATLIGERTLLTAAHCLDDSPTVFSASNQADVKGWPGDAITIVDKRSHPKWAQGNTNYDVGLVLLESAPNVQPKRWNRVPLVMPQLPEVRAIGFGETHLNGSGVRYQAMLPVTSLTSSTLYLGNGTGASTCFGDSGGPSMHRAKDGVERIVGVHSFANSAACNGGGDIRVDAIADFIDEWTRDKAPTCSTDGACVMGCPEQDLDCFCLTDGACTATCPLPDTDKDCPKNCLADGVCAFGACGAADPDCQADGELCASAEMCAGHQCLTDAQHPDAYCSRTCSSNAACDPRMRCNFGVCRYPVLPLATMGEDCVIGQTHCSGGVCAGQSEEIATCRVSCDSGGTCPGSMVCVPGALGVSYCQGTVVLEATLGERPAAPKRCSIAGGELCLALAALALLRAKRGRT